MFCLTSVKLAALHNLVTERTAPTPCGIAGGAFNSPLFAHACHRGTSALNIVLVKQKHKFSRKLHSFFGSFKSQHDRIIEIIGDHYVCLRVSCINVKRN